MDFLVIFAIGSAAFQFVVASPGVSVLNYSFVVSLVALSCYVGFLEGHVYRLDMLLDEARSIRSTILCWTLMFGMMAAAASLAREPMVVSRLWFGCFYLCGGVALVGARCAVALLIRHWVRGGNFVKSVIFAGANEMTARLIGRLEGGRSGIFVAGVFDMGEGAAVASLRGVPVLGGWMNCWRLPRPAARIWWF